MWSQTSLPRVDSLTHQIPSFSMFSLFSCQHTSIQSKHQRLGQRPAGSQFEGRDRRGGEGGGRRGTQRRRRASRREARRWRWWGRRWRGAGAAQHRLCVLRATGAESRLCGECRPRGQCQRWTHQPIAVTALSISLKKKRILETFAWHQVEANRLILLSESEFLHHRCWNRDVESVLSVRKVCASFIKPPCFSFSVSHFLFDVKPQNRDESSPASSVCSLFCFALCRQHRPVWADPRSVWGTENHLVSPVLALLFAVDFPKCWKDIYV